MLALRPGSPLLGYSFAAPLTHMPPFNSARQIGNALGTTIRNAQLICESSSLCDFNTIAPKQVTATKVVVEGLSRTAATRYVPSLPAPYRHRAGVPLGGPASTLFGRNYRRCPLRNCDPIRRAAFTWRAVLCSEAAAPPRRPVGSFPDDFGVCRSLEI
jgi:hypothetical protein